MNSVILVDRRARIVFPSDSPTAYTDLANEVDRLNTKCEALTAEVLDLRAKLSQMADDAVKVMAKSLRDVEEMREHLASKDVHCPGTDSDCPRACTTILCEIMVERARHGCG